MRSVALAKDLSQRIRGGHPWVYRDALDLRRGAPEAAGEIVDLRDRKNAFVARGFLDPDGPIALRVLSLDDTPIDDAFLAGRVARACEIRRAAATAGQLDSDALRLLHGEGDLVPGLVLDDYAGTAVVRFDGAAAAAFWRPRIPVVAEACRAAGHPIHRIWARSHDRRGPGAPLLGDEPTEPVIIREGAARFEVDVVRGQKTGFFLDQRENRRRVGELARGVTVLNLFAYTGGFSVAAALGGASAVTTVDLARPAIDAARRNLARNGAAPAASEAHAADVFDFLARAADRRWDIVVCDPPSFAPSARVLDRALAAYRDLARASARAVAPGGLLFAASCSSHVTVESFRAAVAAGIADAGRESRLLDVRGAGADHPVLAAFPEGRYLKLLVLML